MKLAWLSDIHLDMVSKETIIQLGTAINECDCESAIITGDIANGRSVIQVLSLLDETVRKPIYFVLGNHDSYYGSFQKIHYNMRKFSRKSKFCKWMTSSNIIQLTDDTCIVGHDGFYDGRNGKFFGPSLDIEMNSDEGMFLMNDFFLIKEIAAHTSRKEKLKYFNKLGDKSAKYFSKTIKEAAKSYKKIIAITHVPPFEEVSKHRGESNSVYALPFYSCKAVGDVLLKLKNDLPNNQIVMFAGHTHCPAEMHSENLHVYVAGAKYTEPEIFNIIVV